MPGLPQRNDLYCNGSSALYSLPSNGFWSKHRDHVSYNQLHKFWSELSPQSRQELLRIEKQTLFEQARRNMYCSRCNGLLLEGFQQIVMYGKSLQQDGVVGGDPLDNRLGVSKNQINGGSFISNDCQDEIQDPSVHPWGGLNTTRDGSLTLMDCYLYPKTLLGLQSVFDSARGRERERELLYPDACGGGGRGWLSQGMAGYGRGHGTREACALHTAKLSCDTLVDFWSALGEETRQSLLRMKEDDFIERLMCRFDSKRFCRDCRRNVIREFKELKELKRMRREPQCTSWFCVADTAFQYEVSDDTIQADWRQTFTDTIGTYNHFEWAVGTGEGKSDIREFENTGLNGYVKVDNLDLTDLSSCFITLRAWKLDGRCTELYVKAHALKGRQCVHGRLSVGDGLVTITRGDNIRLFFEHAEETEEEEDDDSMDNDGNELDGECSRPQKHAKSPELAREFLLDAATVIFKEQVEKAFREGTARQNAHSIFVCLALNLLEECVHIACKEIITLQKQTKLLEEEENEKREEEERRERRRTKEQEKKIRRKERLKVKEKSKDVLDKSLPSLDEPNGLDSVTEIVDSPDREIADPKDGNRSFMVEQSKFSRRRLKLWKEYQLDQTRKWSDRGRFDVGSEIRKLNYRSEPRRATAPKPFGRHGSKINEKYDSCSCCSQNNEHRSNFEQCSSKSEQFRRGIEYNQVDYDRDSCGRSKTKVISGSNYSRKESIYSKKVWEPIESQKYPRNKSNSDDKLLELNGIEEKEYSNEIDREAKKSIEPAIRSCSGNSTSNSSVSSSSNPDNGSSLNNENPESSSFTSDSEDANPQTEEPVTNSGQSPGSSGINDLENVTISRTSDYIILSSRPRQMLPPMHNQNLQTFQASKMDYYNQTPLPWQASAPNYASNGSSPGVFPIYRPIDKLEYVNLERSRVCNRGEVFEASIGLNTDRMIPAVLNVRRAPLNQEEKRNNSFSFFHFGGPAALSTGSKSNPLISDERILEDLWTRYDDWAYRKDTTIEEYSLFAVSQGTTFPLY